MPWLCMLRASFVDVSALSRCIVLYAFIVVFSMCLVYVNMGSRVSPNTSGLMVMGGVGLCSCSASCVLYSDGLFEDSACCPVWTENETICLYPCTYFLQA